MLQQSKQIGVNVRPGVRCPSNNKRKSNSTCNRCVACLKAIVWQAGETYRHYPLGISLLGSCTLQLEILL